jgi:hypothetical protein
MLAAWELGNFRTLLDPETPRPEIYRGLPANPFQAPGKGASGCTQAAINRASGQTTPADCHARAAPGARKTQIT